MAIHWLVNHSTEEASINIGVSHSGDCIGLQNRRRKSIVGSSPTAPANITWTPQVESVSGIVVWVLGSPERSLINLDVLLRRKVVPSKARISKHRGNYVSAKILPFSQVVRHRTLTPAFVGSKPTGAAKEILDFTIFKALHSKVTKKRLSRCA